MAVGIDRLLYKEEMKRKLRQVLVEFSTLPYSELNPNNLRRTHWSVRSQVTQIAREEAFLAGKQLGIRPPIEHYEVDEVFTVPTRRRADIEGLIGACKPWIDGLQDAGVILQDDCWHLHRIAGSVKYQKGIEGTEFIIREVDDDTV